MRDGLSRSAECCFGTEQSARRCCFRRMQERRVGRPAADGRSRLVLSGRAAERQARARIPGECERGEDDAVHSPVLPAGPISPASAVRMGGCSAGARADRRAARVAWRPAAALSFLGMQHRLRRVSRSSDSSATRVLNWLEGASTVQHVPVAGRLLDGHVWGWFGHAPESAPVRCIRRCDR